MRFDQNVDFQSELIERGAISPSRQHARYAALLAVIGFLVSAFSTPVYGAEARRCLRDGKVIITNVTCELLGNAIEQDPLPDKHFKRGEPPARTMPLPPPVKTEVPPTISPPQPPNQTFDSLLRYTVSSMFTYLLLPVMLFSALVAWLKRRTRRAATRFLREVLTVKTTTLPMNHREAPPPPAPTKIEPSLSDQASRISDEPKPTGWSLELIRSIEWKRFEDICQQFYEMKGIRSETTSLGADGGIDIRLYQDDLGQATSIVQCKAWGDRFVGVKPVRELLGVMTHEKIGKAFFMTSGAYSDEAKVVADANRITLIDGPMLLMMIQRLPAEKKEALLAFATAGDYTTPTCSNCGVKMRAVAGKGGRPDFWGCPNYPRCHQTLGKRR